MKDLENYQQIKKEATAFVKNAFAEATTKYSYHNWKHTQFVLRAGLEIMNGTPSLTKLDKQIIELATLFHDIGFTKSKEDHEECSAQIAQEFLEKQNVDKSFIASVRKTILATKMGTVPNNLLEQVIQDADLAHMGKKEYASFYNALFKEVKAFHKPDTDQAKWKEMCIDFFNTHTYHTKFAIENYSPYKETNKQKIMALDNETLPKVKSKKNKKKRTPIPEKGIETMFRVSLRNHTNLSRIADNKANTLISVNAIIISIVLSTLFPKLDNNPNLIYPGISLLIVNIATIIVAILSVIPKTTHGQISREQVENKQGNLMFFGNFHNMSIEDFEWGMDEIMNDKDYLYKTLTRDLFYLGKVLNRKYIFLRIGYYIFIIGLVISIGVFLFHLQGSLLWN